MENAVPNVPRAPSSEISRDNLGRQQGHQGSVGTVAVPDTNPPNSLNVIKNSSDGDGTDRSFNALSGDASVPEDGWKGI